jgi:hypothetical protein
MIGGATAQTINGGLAAAVPRGRADPGHRVITEGEPGPVYTFCEHNRPDDAPGRGSS